MFTQKFARLHLVYASHQQLGRDVYLTYAWVFCAYSFEKLLTEKKYHYVKLTSVIITPMSTPTVVTKSTTNQLARARAWTGLQDDVLKRQAAVAANQKDPEALWGLLESPSNRSAGLSSRLACDHPSNSVPPMLNLRQ